MVYAKFGGQTECIMGNWKIVKGSPCVKSKSRGGGLCFDTLAVES